MRGEYRREYSSSEFLLGSPPLARGVLNTIPTIARSGRITPACAGSTARGNVFLQRFQDHPRLRGEYFISLGTDTEILGSPPLARGVLSIFQKLRNLIRITPACAGSTLFVDNSFAANRDHPRLRGEYLPQQEVLCVVSGSPPLARGVQEPRT